MSGSYLTLTVRARVDESVLATASIEEIEVPEAGLRGVIVPLDLELGPVDVMDGDRLTVEVLVAAEEAALPGAEPARFAHTLEGRPTDWLGAHRPDAAQLWRLWYGIDQAGAASRMLRLLRLHGFFQADRARAEIIFV